MSKIIEGTLKEQITTGEHTLFEFIKNRPYWNVFEKSAADKGLNLFFNKSISFTEKSENYVEATIKTSSGPLIVSLQKDLDRIIFNCPCKQKNVNFTCSHLFAAYISIVNEQTKLFDCSILSREASIIFYKIKYLSDVCPGHTASSSWYDYNILSTSDYYKNISLLDPISEILKNEQIESIFSYLLKYYPPVIADNNRIYQTIGLLAEHNNMFNETLHFVKQNLNNDSLIINYLNDGLFIYKEKFQKSLPISNDINKLQKISLLKPCHFNFYFESKVKSVRAVITDGTNNIFLSSLGISIYDINKHNNFKVDGVELPYQSLNFSENQLNLLKDLAKLTFNNNNLTNSSIKVDDDVLEVLFSNQENKYYVDGVEYNLSNVEPSILIEIDRNYCLKFVPSGDLLCLGSGSFWISPSKKEIYRFSHNEYLNNLAKQIGRLGGVQITEGNENKLKYNPAYFQNIKRFILSEEVKEDFKLDDVVIDAYFEPDCDLFMKIFMNGWKVKTVIKCNGKEVRPEQLNPYASDHYNLYREELKHLGFNLVTGMLENEETMDLIFQNNFPVLEKLCNVHVPIDFIKTPKFGKVNRLIKYKVGLFEVIYKSSDYNEDELKLIFEGIKRKFRYVILPSKEIVDLSNVRALPIRDDIERLNLSEADLSKPIVRPTYFLFKYLEEGEKPSLPILKEMVDRLNNVKIAPYELPPIEAKLRKYQKEGFLWLTTLYEDNLNGILADDMGLGKTLQTICLLEYAKEKRPSLIICPMSLIFNWINEINKFAPYAKIIPIYGLANKRVKTIENINQSEKVYYITSYDSLRNDITHYRGKAFSYIVLDEAQNIKNSDTLQSKAVKDLHSLHRLALTGTPMENSILDLHSIFNFLMPGFLPEAKDFAKMPIEKINKMVRPFILRREKKDVLKDLPPKNEKLLSSEMTESQNKIYEAVCLKSRELVNEGKLFGLGLMSVINKLRRICVHPKIEDPNYKGDSNKINLLSDILTERIPQGHRFLIFSEWTDTLDIVESLLKTKNIKYFRIDGKVPAAQRKSIELKFNNDITYKVVISQTKAGGTGLNFTGADTVIHLDPWWNVSVENQASDRAHRIGQTREVEVIKLICQDSVEQKVIELQRKKKKVFDAIVKGTDAKGGLKVEDLMFLLS